MVQAFHSEFKASLIAKILYKIYTPAEKLLSKEEENIAQQNIKIKKYTSNTYWSFLYRGVSFCNSPNTSYTSMLGTLHSSLYNTAKKHIVEVQEIKNEKLDTHAYLRRVGNYSGSLKDFYILFPHVLHEYLPKSSSDFHEKTTLTNNEILNFKTENQQYSNTIKERITKNLITR